jgi:hypothetical protein
MICSTSSWPFSLLADALFLEQRHPASTETPHSLVATAPCIRLWSTRTLGRALSRALAQPRAVFQTDAIASARLRSLK